MSDPLPSPESPGTDAHLKSGMCPEPASTVRPGMPSAEEPIVYQPISGWAIAGLAIGGLFTLLVASSAVVAFFQGAPFFFPVWIMGIAILGIAVSLYAQRHVQYSEGTRAGANLARWGFRLSLVSGLMYFSYYYVTKITLENQANDFVMDTEMKEDAGFFARLREGLAGTDLDHVTQLNYAFLLTQAPNARSARPENEKNMRKAYDAPIKDGASGDLTNFRESLLARILYKDLGKDAVITPLAVLDWRYEKSSHKIYRAYRIKTKEIIEMDFLMVTCSAEPETAGQGRKWFVNLKESHPMSAPKWTEIGRGMIDLRGRAIEWLTRRIQELNEGEAFAGIKEADQTRWQFLPPDDGKYKERQALVHQAFAGTGKNRIINFQILTRADQPGKWEQVAGKIRTYQLIRFMLLKGSGEPPPYQLEGLAVLETKQAIDPAKLEPDTPVEWNLVGVEITAFSTPQSPGAGGPGGPPLKKGPG